MFLEEFSSFLEGLVSTTSALLVAGDFNFHIDEPNDCDARRFLQVLESFDLIQHVSEATHKKGHILDLIITRAHEKLVGRCTVDNPFVSDHFVYTVCWTLLNYHSSVNESHIAKFVILILASFVVSWRTPG